MSPSVNRIGCITFSICLSFGRFKLVGSVQLFRAYVVCLRGVVALPNLVVVVVDARGLSWFPFCSGELWKFGWSPGNLIMIVNRQR